MPKNKGEASDDGFCSEVALPLHLPRRVRVPERAPGIVTEHHVAALLEVQPHGPDAPEIDLVRGGALLRGDRLPVDPEPGVRGQVLPAGLEMG